MQFVTLYTVDPAAVAKGPPSGEHMAAMMKKINEALASGKLIVTAPVGKRTTSAARVTLKDGNYTVDTAPDAGSVLFGAMGVSICAADTKEQMIEESKTLLADMGDGTIELIGLAFPAMTKENQAAVAPGGALTNGVIPYINVEGVAKASEFYQKAFGAREIARMPAQDGKRVMHCHMEINGGSLMMSDPFPEHSFPYAPSPSVTMQLVVKDGGTWWKRAVDAGCKITMPLERAFWGDRYGRLADPFGINWAINEPA
ncbi:MAG: VOC family protein [Rhodospirillaceae bacterium]